VRNQDEKMVISMLNNADVIGGIMHLPRAGLILIPPGL
jgi:hypothetical protein